MNVGLAGRLLLASALLAIVVAAAVLALIASTRGWHDATDRRADAHMDLAAADQVERDVLDLESGVRGFVITGDERFLGPWHAARRRLPGDLAALRRRLADRGDDRPQAEALANASTAYLRDYSEPLIAAVRAGRLQAISGATTEAGKRRVDAIRGSIARLSAHENAQAARQSTTAGDEADAATRLGIGALIGSTALIALFGVYLLRRVVGPIRRVSSAADELAAGVLTAPAPERGAPELAQLGRSFNEMASTITEHRAQMDGRNRELASAKRDADRANLAKSEFLSRMSHELRTPLNAILGFAQLLELDELDAEQRDSLAQITRGGQHLLQLIDEVLDIARVETGELRMSPEPVEVGELIGETLALVAPLAEHRSISLVSDVEADTPVHVVADRQRLKQIVLNLLSNAIKYNRQAGEVRVWLECDARERIAIRVRDSGAGLSSEQLSRLFAPFERLGAERGPIEGTGLGLALSRRLAEAMGATVEVSSAPGEGSTFSVCLQAVAAPQFTEERSDRAPAPILGDLTILYIEDNLSNLRLVERALARHATVRFLPAMQGSIGLELARQHEPDIILLDQHLPDLRGDEVLVRLKAEPATRRTPVVMLSADASPGQIRRLRDAGAAAYLTKPIDLRQLLDVVAHHLAESRSTRG